MIINNLKELRERGILESGDILFLGSHFGLCGNHFYSYDGDQGNATAKLFQGQDKEKLCSEAYGYPSSKGSSFPEFKYGDYEAAYRVAEKIYVEILCQGSQTSANAVLSYIEAVEHIRKNGITEFVIDFSQFKGGSLSDSKLGLFFGLGDTMISYYDKDTNNKNRGRFDFDYRWIVSWDDCYTGLFELVREGDVPEGTCGLLSSVKKAEEVTGTSLISDYSMLTSTDIFGTTFGFPSSSSCASVSGETSEKCCTSEKKKHKRFKIQDFLNDRNRK